MLLMSLLLVMSKWQKTSKKDERTRLNVMTLVENHVFGITLRTTNRLEGLIMTYKYERIEVLRQFLKLELKETAIMLVRSVPSLLFWVWFVLWALK